MYNLFSLSVTYYFISNITTASLVLYLYLSSRRKLNVHLQLMRLGLLHWGREIIALHVTGET